MYTIVGTAYVHKYQEGEKWCHEELDLQVSCDLPSYPEAAEDFRLTVAGYDWDDLPAKEGYYAIQYAARITWHTDYWGETDADADVLWSNIVELSEKEIAYVIGEELPAEEEKFFELVTEFGGPVEKI